MKEHGSLYHEIDEAFGPFSLILELMTSIGERTADDEFDNPVVVTEMTVNMPIEMEVHIDDQGGMTIGSAPPTQKIETTFMPVFQNARLTIAPIDELYGEDE